MEISTLKRKVVRGLLVGALSIMTLSGVATVVSHSVNQVPAVYADGCGEGGVNPPPGYDENCNPLPTPTPTATPDPGH